MKEFNQSNNPINDSSNDSISSADNAPPYISMIITIVIGILMFQKWTGFNIVRSARGMAFDMENSVIELVFSIKIFLNNLHIVDGILISLLTVVLAGAFVLTVVFVCKFLINFFKKESVAGELNFIAMKYSCITSSIAIASVLIVNFIVGIRNGQFSIPTFHNILICINIQKVSL